MSEASVLRRARAALKQFAQVRQHSDDEGVWRTIRGRRVFIREGEDVEDALRRSLKTRMDESNTVTKARLRQMIRDGRWEATTDATRQGFVEILNVETKNRFTVRIRDWNTGSDKTFAAHHFADETEGVWRTINGRRVFIKKGEDVKTAMERSLVGDKAQTKEQHRAAMTYHANMAKRAAAAGDKAAAARHEAAVGAHAHAVDKGDKLSSMKANLRSGAAHDTRMTDRERRGSRDLSQAQVISHAKQVLKRFEQATGIKKFIWMKKRRVAWPDDKRLDPERYDRLLRTGSADEPKDGVWRTVRGRRVFIRKGESPTEAIQRNIRETGTGIAHRRDPRRPRSESSRLKESLKNQIVGLERDLAKMPKDSVVYRPSRIMTKRRIQELKKQVKQIK